MTTDEFESLVEGAEETPTLEFKGPISWVRTTFMKDILALSNMIDGGWIVVGIEDETYERVGLSEDQVASYVPDTMRDQMAPYADPFVGFSRYVVVGADGKTFVVIRVQPFEQSPVICKKQSDDVYAGQIYYRTSVGKPSSVAVPNSTDMRTIIETAIGRRLHALQQVGIVPSEPESDEPKDAKFDDELGDLQ